MEVKETSFERIDKKNIITREKFLKEHVCVKRHQWEWADKGCSYNIQGKGSCPNACKYCYVTAMNIRFKRNLPSEPESTTTVEEKKRSVFVKAESRINKKWKKSSFGDRVYMFPSSHDIFPENVDDYCKVAKKCISIGNSILCVSKPRLECIKIICEELKEHKNNFRFRFTIGSDNDSILKIYEPFAPSFQERKECVLYALEKGFDVSISMEPLLDDPENVIMEFGDKVSSIWIGMMNYCSVLKLDYTEIRKLEENIETYFERYKSHPKVFWKEAVRSKLANKKIELF